MYVSPKANSILEDTVRRVRSIKGGAGVKVTNSAQGIVISLAPDRSSDPSPQVRARLFPVLVKQNGGADGTWDNTAGTGTRATWAYDLYPLPDTGYTSKLNTSALQPKRSAARVAVGPVTQAADGDPGMAYFDASGAIQLWDCPELVGAEKCS